jgi:Peptidase propeptide and YPEB domain
MNKRKSLLIGAAVVAALGVGGTAFAVAGGGDDDEKPISGKALDRASAAALEHTGGGNVTETEAGDEESYYEVEVTRADGSQVDVQLDRGFKVVGDKTESSGEDDQD